MPSASRERWAARPYGALHIRFSAPTSVGQFDYSWSCLAPRNGRVGLAYSVAWTTNASRLYQR
jgi:hypothetical protein